MVTKSGRKNKEIKMFGKKNSIYAPPSKIKILAEKIGQKAKALGKQVGQVEREADEIWQREKPREAFGKGISGVSSFLVGEDIFAKKKSKRKRRRTKRKIKPDGIWGRPRSILD